MAGNLEKLTFEKALERLESVVGQLETGELSLDEALALFQEGVSLARHCDQRLGDAEARIEKLIADGSTVSLDEGPATE